MIYHTYLSRSNSLHKKLINIYIYIYIYNLYIYYTIFSVETCRNELESPKKIPTRLYSLQGRDTSLWYTSKIGSGQNLLSRPDPTNRLVKRGRLSYMSWMRTAFSYELNKDDFLIWAEWGRLLQMNWIRTPFSYELNEDSFFKWVEWGRLFQKSWMGTTFSYELNEDGF
jgi:hypothetical protein